MILQRYSYLVKKANVLLNEMHPKLNRMFLRREVSGTDKRSKGNSKIWEHVNINEF